MNNGQSYTYLPIESLSCQYSKFYVLLVYVTGFAMLVLLTITKVS